MCVGRKALFSNTTIIPDTTFIRDSRVLFFFRYEPKLHPGVTYKCKNPKATLKIFSTGSVTVTAPSVANVQRAVEHIYPLVEAFQKQKTKQDKLEPIPKILGNPVK